MSVVLAGVGKLQIASRYLLQGRTLLGVISKPVNSTVCSEDELVGIEGDTVVSTEVEPVDCLKEALCEVVCPEQGIIDALGLFWYVRDKFVESP